MVEELKDLDQLLNEDPRFAEMMAFGAEEGEPGYTLRLHYERFAMLDWPRNAPEEIVNGFVTAQHLAIYSWFTYPFAAVAALQALVTLEHALRRRMSNEPARGLKQRLRYAVSQGWVRGDRLRRLDPYLQPVTTFQFSQRPFDPHGAESLATFVDNLPEARNWLAHGNWIGGRDPFMTLDVVLQLINQLYAYDAA